MKLGTSWHLEADRLERVLGEALSRPVDDLVLVRVSDIESVVAAAVAKAGCGPSTADLVKAETVRRLRALALRHR